MENYVDPDQTANLKLRVFRNLRDAEVELLERLRYRADCRGVKPGSGHPATLKLCRSTQQ